MRARKARTRRRQIEREEDGNTKSEMGLRQVNRVRVRDNRTSLARITMEEKERRTERGERRKKQRRTVPGVREQRQEAATKRLFGGDGRRVEDHVGVLATSKADQGRHRGEDRVKQGATAVEEQAEAEAEQERSGRRGQGEVEVRSKLRSTRKAWRKNGAAIM